jgi:hypothetical protein
MLNDRERVSDGRFEIEDGVFRHDDPWEGRRNSSATTKLDLLVHDDCVTVTVTDCVLETATD